MSEINKIKDKINLISTTLVEELNDVLEKHGLSEMHVDSFRLKRGERPHPNNCRKVCRIWTDPRTGERKIICKTICD